MRRQVIAVLRGIAEEIVGVAVPDAEPLMAAGLDSLGAVELRTRVQACSCFLSLSHEPHET